MFINLVVLFRLFLVMIYIHDTSCCTWGGTVDGWVICGFHININWYEAEEYCQNWHPNGHLASFHNEVIKDYVHGFCGAYDYWIGVNNFELSTSNGKCNWRWTNGQTWCTGQQNELWYGTTEPDQSGSQRCGQWRDSLLWTGTKLLCTESCTKNSWFICSRPESGGSNPWDNVEWIKTGDGANDYRISCDLTTKTCPSEFSKCYGTNHLSACHSPNGTCTDYNVCHCQSGAGYETPATECANWRCGTKRDDENDVCGDVGDCVKPGLCNCHNGKIGVNCDTWNCFGDDKDSGQVCTNQKGVCTWWDQCKCDYMHMGRECQFNAACRGPNEIEEDGRCYIHSSNLGGATNWFDGEKSCRQWNSKAHLVSITNRTVNDRLDALFPGLFWIGANNILWDHTDYIYTDGFNISLFENWKVGQKFDVGEFCVINEGGQGWSTFDCKSSTYNFVCSYEICTDPDLPHCQVVNKWDRISWNDSYPFAYCDIQDGSNCPDIVNRCYGIYYDDESNVCSGHGDCVNYDVCSCGEGWYGLQCEIPYICFGDESNSGEVCMGNGVCLSNNTCRCYSGYYGKKCFVGYCFGIMGNETNTVCSGNGRCVDDNLCDCENGFFTKNCSMHSCFGILVNDSKNPNMCSGHGKCINLDTCVCVHGYFGVNCSVIPCHGVLSNESSVCSGNGICNFHTSECNCHQNYFGLTCNITKCNQIWSNDTSRRYCTGRGDCHSYNKCTCGEPEIYNGLDCQNTTCGKYDYYDVGKVCHGHGTCIEHDICECENEYYNGSLCEDWSCYGISNHNVTHSCHGNGICAGRNSCECYANYNGSECQIFSCGEYLNNHTLVCNRRGICRKFNECSCHNGYAGNLCQSWKCNGEYPGPSACSGNGVCRSPNSCDCYENYEGSNCQTYVRSGTSNSDEEDQNVVGIVAAVLAPTVSIGLILLVLLLCCFLTLCCCALICIVLMMLGFFIFACFSGTTTTTVVVTNQKRRSRMNSFFEKEQELEKNSPLKHLQIDKSLFQIDLNDIHIKKILGEGGSNSTVYLSLWNNREVAFKCFRTTQIFSGADGESNYEDFEKEARVMCSVSHPNILQFFGCCLQTPRIGIVMEYCSKGDMRVFMVNYRQKHDDKPYPIFEKVRMCHELASAMSYLHSRNVVHRDIKPENVLIDSNDHIKVMDFGLSKITSNSQAKTKRIGTMLYIAPEVVKGGKYDSLCDVFSFAILMYVILTERWAPYGTNMDETYCIELKVAQDPNYRPDIKYLEEMMMMNHETTDDGQKVQQWMIDLITTCWNGTPNERYEFHEIDDFIRAKMLCGLEDLKKGVSGSTEKMYQSLQKERSHSIRMKLEKEEEKVKKKSFVQEE